VLGLGAHPDPASELAPALAAARRAATAAGRGLAVVASVTGTEADPQGRSRQAAALDAAGAVVMESNAQAARLAALIAARAAARAP
jgi:FdrA protein